MASCSSHPTPVLLSRHGLVPALLTRCGIRDDRLLWLCSGFFGPVGTHGSGHLHARRPVTARFGRATPPKPADFNHMSAVGADLLATLFPGKTGFFSREFMSRSLPMRGGAAFTRDLTLFALIHRRKSAGSFLVFHGNSFSDVFATFFN
jgi:hypothetical protein